MVILKKKRYNKLAKFHFKDFKNLVIQFKEFTENRPDNIQMVMHNIKNSIPPPNHFSQINVISPKFFQNPYLVGKKNDDGFLGAHIIFRDFFDFPEEL